MEHLGRKAGRNRYPLAVQSEFVEVKYPQTALCFVQWADQNEKH